MQVAAQLDALADDCRALSLAAYHEGQRAAPALPEYHDNSAVAVAVL